MLKVIDQLIIEHQVMLQLFNELLNEGVTSDLGRMKLSIAEDWLMRHLEREEMELYPKMLDFADATMNAPSFFANLQDDWSVLSLTLLDFFQNFHQGLADKELQVAFTRLYRLLVERVHYEETYIFPVLKQVEQGDSLYTSHNGEQFNKYFSNEVCG